MPYLLLFVVLVEGFTTLALQMVALRSAVPLVGSSVILTSVVIGVILLALAVGYRSGGRLTSRLSDAKITKVLSWFLFGAGVYYLVIVFPFQEGMLLDLVAGMPYIWALFLYSLLFFFLPVAAASHTMPMITQLTTGTKGFAAWKILFVSTIGSFLGSVLTSTLLFSWWGVALTGYVTAGLLIVCHMALVIYQKRFPRAGVIVLIAIATLYMGQQQTQANIIYTHDSPYQQIVIREDLTKNYATRSMILNGGFASSINLLTNTSRFGYIRAAVQASEERDLLSSVAGDKQILVIGAAGFTYPQELSKKSNVIRIDTVDVDPAVKPIAEKYLRQRSLDPKVNFIVQSARGFLREQIEKKTHYDHVLVDAYNGTSIPDELVTREFFDDLLKVSDYVMLNMIMDKTMQLPFSQHLLATLHAARPQGVRYKSVSDSTSQIGNFLIASRPFGGATQYTNFPQTEIYTDDKHSIETDKAAMFYGRH